MVSTVQWHEIQSKLFLSEIEGKWSGNINEEQINVYASSKSSSLRRVRVKLSPLEEDTWERMSSRGGGWQKNSRK